VSLPFSRTTRSLAADSSRQSLYLGLSAAALFALWLGWFTLGQVTLYEVSRQARLEVETAPHPVSAPVAGKIVASHLALAKEVKAGEVLVELDASTERLRLKEEETRLAALPPQIQALEAEITAAEAAGAKDHRSALDAIASARSRLRESNAIANFASDHARRLAELRKTGRVSEIDALRVGAESQQSRAAAEAIGAEIHRLEMESQTRSHQNEAQLQELRRRLADFQGQVVTATASIARLQAEIDKHTVRAPVDGRIGDMASMRPGTFVAEGEKFGTVVPSGALRIVAEFLPAAVLGRIRPDQPAQMRLSGFPWAQYGTIPARVSRVATEIRDNLVRVEFAPAAFRNADLLLQHGLPGAVEVELERVSPATLVLRTVGQALATPVTKTERGS